MAGYFYQQLFKSFQSAWFQAIELTHSIKPSLSKSESLKLFGSAESADQTLQVLGIISVYQRIYLY